MRHSSLPAPGDDEQLALLIGRIFSQQLDRSKPLWEMWLVQGLEGNRFALDQQDAPRARRRHLRGRPRDRAVRRQPGAGRAHAAGAPVGAAARAERRAAARAQASQNVAKVPVRVGRRVAARRTASARDGRRTPPRSPRASARSPGSCMNPAPKVPLNDDDRPAPPLPLGAREPRRLQASSRTRSAARSTTSCWPSPPARCGSWLRGARACAPGARAARAGAGQPAHRGGARHARQPARGLPRAAARLRRGPGRAAAHRARGDGRRSSSRSR